MEELASVIVEASTAYVGQWNRLVSTTNWEKGRIIAQWRAAMKEADVPAGSCTDEAWSCQVGNVTPQHVGRLRRVFERFGATHDQYAGLYWSHLQAALEWPDAEMYLEGAVQNDWSVAQMRDNRCEAMGGQPDEQPNETDAAASELDEDFSAADAAPPAATADSISESIAEVHEADDFSPYDEGEAAPFDEGESDSIESPEEMPSAPRLRPFEALPPLPTDLKEAFELMKLAILAHKVCGWTEIARDDVVSVLESLKQLALAPAE
jgi:hypothetical protein